MDDGDALNARPSSPQKGGFTLRSEMTGPG